jgi:Fe2+ transport system protein FeoA
MTPASATEPQAVGALHARPAAGGSTSSIPLSDLAVGMEARFHESRLDADACHLLSTLGLTRASLVRLCKAGEPYIVQVRGTRIGLSKAVAGSIFVVPEPRSSADS